MKNPEVITTGTAEMTHAVLSKSALLKSFLLALILAAAALLFAILPAEYGVDPTGIGGKLGLTQLAGNDAAKAEESSGQKMEKQSATPFREDTATVSVPVGSGVEYKFQLLRGEAMKYSWNTGGAPLFFDFHGEPSGDTTGYFESYAVSTSSTVRGTFTAPFDGSHGWYWKNKTNKPVTVTLATGGSYEIIGLK